MALKTFFVKSEAVYEPVGSNLQALFLCSGIYSKMIFTDRVVK